MPDNDDEHNHERLDLRRYMEIARRNNVRFLLSLLLGWLVVWGISWVLQPRYKSNTLILVEQPTLPKNYVTPNVDENLQDRLQSITQQILSRTRLLLIINDLHLYAASHDNITPDEQVMLMRKNIQIDIVHDSNGNEITAFKIYYSAHDPYLAQKVTSKLTDLFINENLRVRQQQSEDTTTFIRTQLDNASTTLAEQEAKIRDFEGEHGGELPAQKASNLQILSGLQSQLQSAQESLNTARQQRVYYQTLIEQSQSLQTATSSTYKTADSKADSSLAIEQQIASLKERLAALNSHYTDRYPDVLNLKAEIAKLEKTREDFVANQMKYGDGTGQLGGVQEVHDGLDSYRSLPVMQLQGQLRANEAEISNRERAIAELKEKINFYQARLNEEPKRERQLADLTRGFDQSKANYDELLKKNNESEMATNMEQMQQGQRFTMLDPPSLPLKPDFPNRLKFSGAGISVGFALGLIVVGLFEKFDDRLHSDNDISSLLPIAVISEIPEILSPSEIRSRNRKNALSWVFAGLVVVAILTGTAFSYLQG
jgi:polysaccharide chain length determinant protein (PEP-CTERM system associated)